MALADNFHSRLVAWLKILLPLLALAILSMLFLVSRSIDPAESIRYSDSDLQDRAHEPRLTAPAFAGMTSDGAAVTVVADEMRPDAGGGQAVRPRLLLETPDGVQTEVIAATGALNRANQRVDLGGGVTLRSSAGYEVTAPRMTGLLDRTDVQATGPVTGSGPPGTLTAGAMSLTRDGDTYVLVFNKGVRLLYQPGQ